MIIKKDDLQMDSHCRGSSCTDTSTVRLTAINKRIDAASVIVRGGQHELAITEHSKQDDTEGT